MKKLMLITPILAGAGVITWNLFLNSMTKDLADRFPEIDPSILRKAYAMFYVDALKGKTDSEDQTDEEMDVVFMTYVMKVTTK